jgi:hypothetical protein
MYKSLVSLAAACAIVSAGMLLATPAQAGGSQSAPTKAGKATVIASAIAPATHRRGGSGSSGLTEFSASSARSHSPRR